MEPVAALSVYRNRPSELTPMSRLVLLSGLELTIAFPICVREPLAPNSEAGLIRSTRVVGVDEAAVGQNHTPAAAKPLGRKSACDGLERLIPLDLVGVNRIGGAVDDKRAARSEGDVKR
jgi:hypothetical protein